VNGGAALGCCSDSSGVDDVAGVPGGDESCSLMPKKGLKATASGTFLGAAAAPMAVEEEAGGFFAAEEAAAPKRSACVVPRSSCAEIPESQL
jgi:hypothetical protein